MLNMHVTCAPPLQCDADMTRSYIAYCYGKKYPDAGSFTYVHTGM